jgi:alpha-tubulin suppressor-like RCC1 family protein
MKNHFFTLLLILCAWLAAGTAQAATPGMVVAWGDNGSGVTTVPVAAQSGVTAIAAGSYHIVVLKNDSSVVMWGSPGITTVPVAAQSGVAAIAAGGYHTVVLKNDGSVLAWGDNRSGQTNVPVAAQSGVTAIAAGSVHTVALKNNGSVLAWGNNYHGQTTVPVVAQSGVMAIGAGGGHTVVLKNDGSVIAWGDNDHGQATVPVAAQSGVTAIAGGGLHTVVLKNDGSVIAWGDNGHGQTTVPVAAQSGVAAIAAGGWHTVALKTDGSVVLWGVAGETNTAASLSGVTAIAAGWLYTVALGVPTRPIIHAQPVSQAVNVWQSPAFTVMARGFALNYQWSKDGVDLAGATSATYSLPLAQTNQAGSSYTVVVSNPAGSVTSAPPAILTVDATVAPGTVVAWGDNRSGQTTVPLAAQSGVTAIAAGGDGGGYDTYGVGHTVALKNDGSVVAWGDNSYGQTAVPVSAQSGVTAVAAGVLHTVALKSDGSVVAWGGNVAGETNTPAGLVGVTAIAAGPYHTVALKNDGTVVAWGANWLGQVTGTPTVISPYSATANPVAPEGQVLSGITAIAAGLRHSVALKNDGTVAVWGYDCCDQTTVPSGLVGVTAIAAGSYHTAALKNDGSVVVWGAGEVTNVPVAAQSGVIAIAAAGDDYADHTVALKNDGTVVAWGDNGSGQVTGIPPSPGFPYSAIASPVTLEGQVLSGVTAIAAGALHTVALIGTVPLRPSLNARPSGNQLILSWSTNAVGFTLQSTLQLTPPATWIDVTNAPALLGAQWTVTNTFSGGAQFYRLRKL